MMTHDTHYLTNEKLATATFPRTKNCILNFLYKKCISWKQLKKMFNFNFNLQHLWHKIEKFQPDKMRPFSSPVTYSILLRPPPLMTTRTKAVDEKREKEPASLNNQPKDLWRNVRNTQICKYFRKETINRLTRWETCCL